MKKHIFFVTSMILISINASAQTDASAQTIIDSLVNKLNNTLNLSSTGTSNSNNCQTDTFIFYIDSVTYTTNYKQLTWLDLKTDILNAVPIKDQTIINCPFWGIGKNGLKRKYIFYDRKSYNGPNEQLKGKYIVNIKVDTGGYVTVKAYPVGSTSSILSTCKINVPSNIFGQVINLDNYFIGYSKTDNYSDYSDAYNDIVTKRFSKIDGFVINSGDITKRVNTANDSVYLYVYVKKDTVKKLLNTKILEEIKTASTLTERMKKLEKIVTINKWYINYSDVFGIDSIKDSLEILRRVPQTNNDPKDQYNYKDNLSTYVADQIFGDFEKEYIRNDTMPKLLIYISQNAEGIKTGGGANILKDNLFENKLSQLLINGGFDVTTDTSEAVFNLKVSYSLIDDNSGLFTFHVFKANNVISVVSNLKYKFTNQEYGAYAQPFTSEPIKKQPTTGFVKINGITDYSIGSLDGYADEQPQNLCDIESFDILDHEVTFGEYCNFLNTSDFSTREVEEYIKLAKPNLYFDTDSNKYLTTNFDFPVVDVSYSGASAYCTWMSNNDTDYKYRLPTEYEWELVANGGKILNDGSSDMGVSTNAWFIVNSGNTAHPTSEKDFSIKINISNNSYSEIYNMCGNVWEWTSSKYDNKKAMVTRGGAFDSDYSQITTYARSKQLPETKMYNLGFRIVRIKNNL